MAEQNPPLFLQQRSDHDADGDRSLIESVFNSREGVIAAGDLAVSQNGTPNMSVNVAAGRAVVKGDDTPTTQGMYCVWNDAVKNLVIAAADATNPRNDLIVARVRDAFYSGATNAWDLFVVQGTPAASPVDPALPNNALLLARVRVNALATSIVTANITDLRPRAASLGGLVVCSSTTRPAAPVQGDMVYETDTFDLKQYTTATTGWQKPWGLPWGAVAAPIQNTTPQGSITTITDLTGTTISWTAVANRRVRMSAHLEATSTITGDYVSLYITDSANTQVARAQQYISVGTGIQGFDVSVVLVPAAGARSYKLRMARTSGTGSVSTGASAGSPVTFSIEDIGPAANPA